ncbi:hypothetical protein [Paenibacillus pini]
MKCDIENGVFYTQSEDTGKAVKRQRYSNMIGYDFGGYIYEGSAYIKNCRQYLFRNTKDNATWVTNYKGFREHIDKYDFPKRKL